MTIRFANLIAFQLLWLIPLIIVLSWYMRRRQGQLMVQHLGSRLVPFLTASLSTKRRQIKLVLEVTAILFFVLALARPQSGASKQKVKSEGVEVLLVVDVSNSMLAEDAKPSRLELAKRELSQFLDLLEGDRVGLVAFAGSAITLSPLTADKSAIKMYLESLSPQTVTTQGTDFRRALDEARMALERGGLDSDDKSVVTKAIVIASDGEDNEPGAKIAAEQLSKDGIKIFSLVFGTETGAPIPVKDETGQVQGYRKDQADKVIMSVSKGEALRDLAQLGGGSFYHVTFGGGAMSQLHGDLRQLQKAQFDSMEITNYAENYQGFLLLGIFLAMLELFFADYRSVGRLWQGRFQVEQP